MSVLDEILAAKHGEVARLLPLAAVLEEQARAAAPARDLRGALRRPDGRLAVLAELKRRSPSKGDLAPDLDAVATAKAYEAGGAAALSVLTDGPHFGGSAADLRCARAAVEIPVLRKDFTIDPVQVHEARAIGADGILLIAAALPDDGVLRALRELAANLGLAALVEVHDVAELERALGAGADLIGVNARDLTTFAEDLSVGEQLAGRIPAAAVAVAESAIRSVDDARRMAAAGFDAVLVGEHLVGAPDGAEAVRALAAVPRSPRPEGGT